MAGVYLSIPFCAQKCTYCNFASGVFPQSLETAYYAAIGNEIREYRWQWTPETVYLGGGTPSRLDGKQLRLLLDAIPGRPWREATLEAAPGDITAEKAEGWRAAGINRVSLGVQSFVTRELAQTGRKHTAATVAADIETLRAAGIANLSVDLIAGLPHQTLDTFSESLDHVRLLAVPHVSVYMLEVDEDSRLGQELLNLGARYGASAVPGEEAIVAMYEMAVERLAACGLARYEISNFARPGAESLHNLKYWRLEPYVGFGADAHSYDGLRRWQNAESAADYVTRANLRQSPRTAETAADSGEERFLVGLRLSEGVSLRPGDRDRLHGTIARFVEQGLLADEGERLRLTGKGILLSNEVFEEFLAA